MGFPLRIGGVGLLLGGCLFALSGKSASGAGFVSLESVGFLRPVEEQGNSSFWLRIGPKLRAEGALLEAELDVEAAMYLSASTLPSAQGSQLALSSLTIESRDTFIGTAPGVLGAHSLTLGRRHYDWSRADQTWSLGLWSPRFLWDPLKPESLGLTGLFYRFQSGRWKATAFASPISIPERGAPVLEGEDGSLRSPSRDFSTPYGGAILMNQVVDIHYRIDRPALSELIFKPGAAVSLGYEGDRGGFASVSLAAQPISTLDITARAQLDSSSNFINTDLRPRVRYRQVATTEGGYRFERGSLWVSSSFERPLDAPALPSDWMTDPMGPAWIGAAGANWRVLSPVGLHASIINVDERKPARATDQLALELPSRFPFERAFRLGVDTTLSPKLRAETLWIRDFTSNGHQLSVALSYAGSAAWSAQVGADLFWGEFSDSGVGRYVGNDRLRGGITCVF